MLTVTTKLTYNYKLNRCKSYIQNICMVETHQLLSNFHPNQDQQRDKNSQLSLRTDSYSHAYVFHTNLWAYFLTSNIPTTWAEK